MVEVEHPNNASIASKPTEGENAKYMKISLDELPKLDEVNRVDSLNQMELITRKAIALHLKSLGITISNTALEELYDLFINYIHGLMQNLQRITQTQRRFKASPKDLRLMLREFNITNSELEEEFIKTKKNSTDITSTKKELEELSNVLFQEPKDEILDPQDPSYVFFSHYNEDAVQLLPPTHKRGKSIPPWLPQFPPDHTYLKTPKFTDRITDQKVVRTKIAEESRLGEKALDHLISYQVKVEKDELEAIDSTSDDVNLVEDHYEKEKTKDNFNIWSVGTEKRFDVEKYANARLKYLEIRDEKKKKRTENIDSEYINLIANLSSYAPDDISYEDNSAELVHKQYISVMRSLDSLKKKKVEREKERKILLEEAKKEKEAKAKAKESTFDDFGSFGKENDGFEDFDGFSNEKSSNGFEFMMEDGETEQKEKHTDNNSGTRSIITADTEISTIIVPVITNDEVIGPIETFSTTATIIEDVPETLNSNETQIPESAVEVPSNSVVEASITGHATTFESFNIGGDDDDDDDDDEMEDFF